MDYCKAYPHDIWQPVPESEPQYRTLNPIQYIHTIGEYSWSQAGYSISCAVQDARQPVLEIDQQHWRPNPAQYIPFQQGLGGTILFIPMLALFSAYHVVQSLARPLLTPLREAIIVGASMRHFQSRMHPTL